MASDAEEAARITQKAFQEAKDAAAQELRFDEDGNITPNEEANNSTTEATSKHQHTADTFPDGTSYFTPAACSTTHLPTVPSLSIGDDSGPLTTQTPRATRILTTPSSNKTKHNAIVQQDKTHRHRPTDKTHKFREAYLELLRLRATQDSIAIRLSIYTSIKEPTPSKTDNNEFVFPHIPSQADFAIQHWDHRDANTQPGPDNV